jgi:ATP-dependent DNA helicase RecG
MARYAESESSVLELKREIPENNQIVKSVVGFCNMHGGRIILGVGNDGEVVGVEQDRPQQTA